MRTVIPHVDDLGGCYGANQAFFTLAARGLVTCGAVMVPAPWFRDVVERAEPAHDIGVHLTLTSEWRACRWAPVSTVSRASGLIDGDGYLWADVASLRRHLVPEAAEAEMRAQVERAVGAGLRPTHLDAHMAAAMLPELLDAYVRLAVEYALLPVLPRSIAWAPDPAAYRDTVAGLDASSAPVVDHCRGTQPVAAEALPGAWRGVIDGLPPGITHLALHCTEPSDFSAVARTHAEWRFGEYAFVAAGGLADLCADADVAVAGLLPLQRAWQRWVSRSPPPQACRVGPEGA